MAQHASTWITIYSINPHEQWRVMQNLENHFKDDDYVVVIHREQDYDRNNDVDFLSHVLHVLNRLLDIKHCFHRPIVIADVSLDFIRRKLENFKSYFLSINIEELFSNRRISTNLRHNKFLFFPNFESKKEFEDMNLPTGNSCTTSNADVCIEEATRFIETLIGGGIEQNHFPEYHALVPAIDK